MSLIQKFFSPKIELILSNDSAQLFINNEPVSLQLIYHSDMLLASPKTYGKKLVHELKRIRSVYKIFMRPVCLVILKDDIETLTMDDLVPIIEKGTNCRTLFVGKWSEAQKENLTMDELRKKLSEIIAK